MTMTSWPYVSQDTTDIEYGRLFREMAGSDGVAASLGSTALEVFGDGSGMNVKVRSGSAIVRGYMFYSTAIETLAIGAPSAATRYDRVVLELNVSAPLVANRLVLKVLPGTSGSANPPALTQLETGIYQISLGIVEVNNGVASIAAGKVQDDRYMHEATVGQWPTNARRPASPSKYKLGFNEALGGWEYYNGSTWVALGAVNLASSSVTGTLPVSKGGTGATTTEGARNTGIDLWVQNAQPAYAVNRVWIKVP